MLFLFSSLEEKQDNIVLGQSCSEKFQVPPAQRSFSPKYCSSQDSLSAFHEEYFFKF